MITYRMIAAGLGDLLGKLTCLCDWKLSRLINGEHYCERTVELVEQCVQDVLADAGKAKDRDPEVLGGIMNGLVLTGVAMSLYGNSRPASGCEHHMSHYWEMMFEQKGERPVHHGTQVGVGTVLVLKAVETFLAAGKPDFNAARTAAARYDAAVWQKEIAQAYGPAAPGVIEMEQTAKKNETSGRLARIDAMEQHWDEIEALLRGLPSSEYVASLLRELNGVSGCWTGDTSGTHFFWGLDRRAALFPLRLRESAGAAALAGQNSLGEAVTVPLTPRALTERLRDGSLLPGLFLCFLEAHFLRDFTVFGGFYQPAYLAEMRRGLVRALRETGGYEEEAAIIEAKRNAMTLGLIYLLRSHEGGRFPVSTAELLEQPVSMLEIEASLQVSVAAALEHLN